MDFIIDAITEWIKDFLIEAITGNLSNMFGDVNTKVATIAGEVGKTPEQWNSGVFSMIHSLSESVIVPIAGLVIAAVLSYELIRMVIDRNNMHDFDTFIFFKWIIKAGIAAYVVSHTFDFIIAIFEVAQTMVQQSAGVIDANASIDISSALASITTELEAKGLGELFALMLETWVVSFAMTVMGALITIILYGRMIEIYIYASVGPLPFATFAKLCTVDRYPSDSFVFSSHGYDLHIDNELVADAFANLPQQEQSILILYCVLDMADGEIASLTGMSRSAVQRHRTKTLKELRVKLMALMPEGG